MHIINKKILNLNILINFLLCLLPLSFIAGNLIINLNLLLIIIFSFVLFGKKIFSLELFLFDKLLIILFCYILISALINSLIYFEAGDKYWGKKILIKSFLFLRYLIFYFIVRFIIDQKIFNFKYFLFSASFCSLFVSLDVVLQFFYGKDLFGYPKSDYKLSGPFGEELIAGAYIQRFSIFIFFLITFFFKPKNQNIKLFTLSFLFILIFFSILITGNRMPTILFLLLYGLVFLVEKRLRSYFLLFVPMIGLIFFLFYNLIPYVQNFTVSFLNRIFEFNTFIKEVLILGSEPRMTNPYSHEFYSGFMTWKLNPFIGGGIDSFYFNCSKTIPFCNSHPHNYYLEILSELGVFGFILIIFILIKLLQILYIKKIYQVTNVLNRLIMPFLLLLIIEIFPLKSSGSFFTTGNTTFIFFLLAIIMGLSRLKTIDLNIKNN